MSSAPFPLFIVAGMPRGGTTFLYHNLRKHPCIFLPFRKEVNFFNIRYGLGVKWYNNLYKEKKNGQVCGDISPPYFLEVTSIQRIKAYNPGAKVILSVRDPVEWALSFYAQFHSFTYTMPSFEDFLKGYEYIVDHKPLRIKFKKNHVVNTVERFMDEFQDNILVFDFSYLRYDSLAILRAIERFVGVPPFFRKGNYDDVKINASGRKNIKIISNLLNQEWVISCIQKLVPRGLTLFLRRQFDRLSASSEKESLPPVRLPYKSKDLQIAELELSAQSEVIKELFQRSPVILGNRAPYHFS